MVNAPELLVYGAFPLSACCVLAGQILSTYDVTQYRTSVVGTSVTVTNPILDMCVVQSARMYYASRAETCTLLHVHAHADHGLI